MIKDLVSQEAKFVKYAQNLPNYCRDIELNYNKMKKHSRLLKNKKLILGKQDLPSEITLVVHNLGPKCGSNPNLFTFLGVQ